MSNRKLVLIAGGILLAAGLIGLVIVTAVYIVTLMVDNRVSVDQLWRNCPVSVAISNLTESFRSKSWGLYFLREPNKQ